MGIMIVKSVMLLQLSGRAVAPKPTAAADSASCLGLSKLQHVTSSKDSVSTFYFTGTAIHALQQIKALLLDDVRLKCREH